MAATEYCTPPADIVTGGPPGTPAAPAPAPKPADPGPKAGSMWNGESSGPPDGKPSTPTLPAVSELTVAGWPSARGEAIGARAGPAAGATCAAAWDGGGDGEPSRCTPTESGAESPAAGEEAAPEAEAGGEGDRDSARAGPTAKSKPNVRDSVDCRTKVVRTTFSALGRNRLGRIHRERDGQGGEGAGQSLAIHRGHGFLGMLAATRNAKSATNRRCSSKDKERT